MGYYYNRYVPPFSSTIFLYNDHIIKIQLLSKIQRVRYTYKFSSKHMIIDDHMLYLQKQHHTKEKLQAKGYIYGIY